MGLLIGVSAASIFEVSRSFSLEQFRSRRVSLRPNIPNCNYIASIHVAEVLYQALLVSRYRITSSRLTGHLVGCAQATTLFDTARKYQTIRDTSETR